VPRQRFDHVPVTPRDEITEPQRAVDVRDGLAEGELSRARPVAVAADYGISDDLSAPTRDPLAPHQRTFFTTLAATGALPSDKVRIMKVLMLWAVVAALFAPRLAYADLKREIQLQQAAANDLKGLDVHKAVADEITLLKQWLDEAAILQDKGQVAPARELLDRCAGQVELIRLKIDVSKVKAEADTREKRVHELKQILQKIQTALNDALVKKKALEMNNQ
jgi:hypothetical protein